MAVTSLNQPYLKPHTTRKLYVFMFYTTGVIADGSYTLRE